MVRTQSQAAIAADARSGSSEPNLLVTGPGPGSGLHGFVQSSVASALLARQPVRILDCDRNYLHFGRLMGATIWRLQSTPRGNAAFTREPSSSGHARRLQLYDFGADGATWAQPLPSLKTAEARVPGLLVVENLAAMTERLPTLEELVARHLRMGGRCCLVDRAEAAFEPYREVCAPYDLKTFDAITSAVPGQQP
jgi:hypothetical protein